jgi:hypothetical protein
VGLYGKLARRGIPIQLKPECARKLVEGAVQYALDLGLPPHVDYRTAKLIFGDISSEACAEEYAFGKDGKPFFIAGPHDSPARCEQILRTLRNHCGLEGHHFLIPAGGPPPMGPTWHGERTLFGPLSTFVPPPKIPRNTGVR